VQVNGTKFRLVSTTQPVFNSANAGSLKPAGMPCGPFSIVFKAKFELLDKAEMNRLKRENLRTRAGQATAEPHLRYAL